MEMILCILVLSVSAAACVRIFSIAYGFRMEAREMNHGKELFSNSAEILRGTDGTAEHFLQVMEGGVLENGHLTYYYDRDFMPCSQEEAVYCMTLKTEAGISVKSADISIGTTDGRTILSQQVRFPTGRTLRKGADR